MHFTTAALTSLLALTATALPSNNPKPTKNTFGLIAIRSGSPVQNSGIQASRSNLQLNLKNQGASCEKPSNFATFYIEDEELKLYSAWAKPQKVYVDRSGMGQGKIGYTSCAEVSLPRNAETKGWKIKDGGLTFKGTGVQVCPGSNGSYTLWLAGVNKPGGNEKCLGIKAKTVETKNPIACYYSEY